MGRHQPFLRNSLFRISFATLLILGFAFALQTSPIALAADPSPVIGNWEGTLDPGAQPKKRIVVHITADAEGILGGTIDYPDDSVSGEKITAIHYAAPTLHLENSAGAVSFDGTMNKDNTVLTGTWKKDAAPLSLTLKKAP
jgi:hypothetical protein